MPKDTPKDIVTRLNATMTQVLADPQVQKRFAELGIGITPPAQQTPEALRAYQKGRSRALVADHQGVENQGGLKG